MKLPRFCLAFLGACYLCQSSAHAELKLAAIFDDNMVLQQRIMVPIWGWDVPGAIVTVKFAGHCKSAHADANGCWIVKLPKLKASTQPQTMVVVSGNSTLTVTNVLVGEVWLASGQSNMEKPLGDQPGQKPCFNYKEELAAANYPEIRLFHADKNLSAAPLADVEKFHGWAECCSNSLNTFRFSAAAYFFGREIHTNMNVPVGVFESTGAARASNLGHRRWDLKKCRR